MQTIPRLRSDIRFSTFDEASATRGRYLVEAGDSCFAVSEEMYHLLTALSEQPATIDDLATTVNARLGQQLSVDTVAQLLATHIPPALLADHAGVVRKTPFIARMRLLSARTVRPLTSRLTWLFTPYATILALVAFAAVMAFAIPDAAAAIHGSFTWKELAFLYISLAIIGLVHELGHATACFRYGCEHGDIGFGLYYIFPAFYADVTKAWRLSAKRRAVIDLGGLYFNALTLIPLGTYALMTGNRIAFRLIWLTAFIMLQNLNPIFKLDGYWLFSDLSGLTNLHARVGDAVARFGRKLLGRSSEGTDAGGLQRGLLRLYIAAVAIYSLFIIDFLVRSIRTLIATYPERASHAAGALVNGLRLSAWSDAAIEAWRIAAMSFWPLILCAALMSFALKLIGRARKFVEEL